MAIARVVKVLPSRKSKVLMTSFPRVGPLVLMPGPGDVPIGTVPAKNLPATGSNILITKSPATLALLVHSLKATVLPSCRSSSASTKEPRRYRHCSQLICLESKALKRLRQGNQESILHNRSRCCRPTLSRSIPRLLPPHRDNAAHRNVCKQRPEPK